MLNKLFKKMCVAFLSISAAFSLLSIPVMGGAESIYPELGYVYGDADASGALTSLDAAHIMNKVLDPAFSMPVEGINPDYLAEVDVNCDGVLTAEDAVMVPQRVLKD